MKRRIVEGQDLQEPRQRVIECYCCGLKVVLQPGEPNPIGWDVDFDPQLFGTGFRSFCPKHRQSDSPQIATLGDIFPDKLKR